MHKVGQPVDETGKTIYPLWTRSQTRLDMQATTAVENRAAMWTTGLRIVEKPPTVTFHPLLTVTSEARHLGNSIAMRDPEGNEFCVS